MSRRAPDPVDPALPRPGALRFRLVASAVVLFAVFFLLEGAARVIGGTLPGWAEAGPEGVLMTGSDTRLWTMAEGRFPNNTSVATINAWGLRGELPELPRPPGRQRVLVLGDSSFFGHGIADDATIAVRLGADLTATGVDVDSFNGAIPGYSTEQTLVLLHEVGFRHEPTLLVVGNLWSDNNVDAYRDRDLLRSVHAARHNPLMKSAFMTLLAGWLDRVRGGSGAHLVTWTHDSRWPRDQDRRVPIQDYAHNLDTIVREAREHGAGVIFVAPVNRGLADSRYDNGAIWDVYFAAQAQVAAWHHVPVVSARAALALDPAATSEKFIDVMHPSALGAQLIADGIAAALHDAGWPGNPLVGRAEPFDASALTDDARSYALPQDRAESVQSNLFPLEAGQAVIVSPPAPTPPAPTKPGQSPPVGPPPGRAPPP